jgi:hypothetical protein
MHFSSSLGLIIAELHQEVLCAPKANRGIHASLLGSVLQDMLHV